MTPGDTANYSNFFRCFMRHFSFQSQLPRFLAHLKKEINFYSEVILTLYNRMLLFIVAVAKNFPFGENSDEKTIPRSVIVCIDVVSQSFLHFGHLRAVETSVRSYGARVIHEDVLSW